MTRMVMSAFFFKSLFIFWYRFFLRPLKSFRRSSSTSNITFETQFKYHNKYSSLLHRSDLNDHTLIFDVEGALLRSSSVFPYFMLVAFEAGGLLRAIILLLSYPFVCLVGDEMGVKIMIMICLFGIKEESFRVGRAVLPKFLLEDVGSEIFEGVINRGGKKVGLSKLPRVMVESFLREYLEIDFVVGKELKVFHGYFVGLVEERKNVHGLELAHVHEGKGSCSDIIGISGCRKGLDHEDFFSRCKLKEVYMVAEADKKSWQKLATENYPKPLIFHDGRLALRPTLGATLSILMWVPCAFILSWLRIIIAISLPFNISTPVLSLSGLHLTYTRPKNTTQPNKPKGHLYVCNHRTLIDPLYISFVVRSQHMVAVTYSLSRMSEIIAPIKTVRLTRKRNEDAKMMKKLLKQGDLVVCPEGTTCREPYLLRFSPLFSEICDEIAPVAIDSHVSMFHGTTAGGLKCLDPVFFLMNPSPFYSLQFLEMVSPSIATFGDARFDVANHVQKQIGNALQFECTKLTRKDKYLILAGNEGIVSTHK